MTEQCACAWLTVGKVGEEVLRSAARRYYRYLEHIAANLEALYSDIPGYDVVVSEHVQSRTDWKRASYEIMFTK